MPDSLLISVSVSVFVFGLRVLIHDDVSSLLRN